MNSQADATAAGAAPKGGFSLGRVLLVAIPLAAVTIGLGAYVLVFEGKINLFPETLHQVSGTVYWNGEAVGSGDVYAKGADGTEINGWIKEDGTFSFGTMKTDRFVEGIAPGTYKVRVGAFDNQKNALGQPSNMTPEKYDDYETSGLTVTVSGPMSDLRFELEGEGRTPPPAEGTPPMGTPPPGAGGRGAGGPGGGGFGGGPGGGGFGGGPPGGGRGAGRPGRPGRGADAGEANPQRPPLDDNAGDDKASDDEASDAGSESSDEKAKKSNSDENANDSDESKSDNN